MSAYFLIVDKRSRVLVVYNNTSGNEVKLYPISCGRALGQKSSPTDGKTIEGKMQVMEIKTIAVADQVNIERNPDSIYYNQDIGYGSYALVLTQDGQWSTKYSIGNKIVGSDLWIHGTKVSDYAFRQRITNGNIVMQMEDIADLLQYIEVEMPVTIGADYNV